MASTETLILILSHVAAGVLAIDQLHAQVFFEENSQLVALEISKYPADSISPLLLLTIPRPSIPGLPLLEADSVFDVEGRAQGHSGRPVAVFVKGERIPVGKDGAFSFSVVLSRGLNQLKVKAKDRIQNVCEKELIVYYNPEMDKTPPGIEVLLSDSVRTAIQSDTVRASFDVTDDSGVFSVVVNGTVIDPCIHDHFHLLFTPVPERITVIAVDVFGNQSSRSIIVREH